MVRPLLDVNADDEVGRIKEDYMKGEAAMFNQIRCPFAIFAVQKCQQIS